MKSILVFIVVLCSHWVLYAQDAIMEVSRDKQTRMYGVIDTEGRTVINFEYDKLRPFNSSRFLAIKNKRWFILDGLGNRLSDQDYDYLSDSKHGYILFYTNDLVRLLNIDEEIIIEPIYEFLFQFDDTYFSATRNSQKGLININEEVIVPFKYDALLMYLDVLFLNKGGKWAIADKQGTLKSDFIYKWVSYKKGDDFISLSMEGERVKIDKDGIVITE